MLDDDGVGAQLDHEVAGVLDAGAGDKKLIAAMEQDNKVIELIAVPGDVADEIEQVEWISSPGVFCRDREFMLGYRQYAEPEAIQRFDEYPPGGFEVFPGANGRNPSLRAGFEGIPESCRAMVKDVVIGQVKNIDSGLFDAIDAI
jgi:hypothetical protein